MYLEQLKKDCSLHGYGRKKWWADQLKVPPLTLSHWLAGRQHPNGPHATKMKELLDQVGKTPLQERWKEYIWDCYYTNEHPSSKILPLIILEILSLPEIDTRTLALLSKIIEKDKPQFDIPDSDQLKNRLGWLLEASKFKVPFTPVVLTKAQSFGNFKGSLSYLRQFQTTLGKKWRVYDFPIKKLKDSLL